MSEGTIAPPPGHSRVRMAVQVLASGAILGLLFRDLDPKEIKGFLANSSWTLLGLALLTKAAGLLLHEVRIWMALPKPRPALGHVVSMGLAAGVLNLVLPARAGDIAIIAFLKREAQVPPAIATTAVGVTSVLEAVLFGGYLLLAIFMGAHHMTGLLGEDVTGWLSVFLLTITAGGIGVIFAGRRIDLSHQRPGILGFVLRTLGETARVLSSGSYMGTQAVTAALQVVLVVTAFTLAMPAAGIRIDHPELAASLILGASSLLAIFLPPVFAAGPAAAAALVLPVFGVPADQAAAAALAYAGAYWLVAHIPAGLMGLPALAQRR
jgi:hypothetical protein